MLKSRDRLHFLLRFTQSLAILSILLPLTSLLLDSPCALGQDGGAAKTAPAPDVLTFTNGDKLTGKLLREASGTVTFHSDMAGDLSIPWDKIQSITTSERFAVIQQGQKISRKTPDGKVPVGPISIQDKQVQVNTPANATAQGFPVANVQYLVDEATFNKEIRGRTGFRNGWIGSATFGAALIQATQTSRSFTGAATAVRTIPNVSWLDPNSRTTFDFNAAYGSVSEPNTTTTKTSILHFDGEQDWYFSSRLFFLVDTSFDHNYSQGLNLQQIYGAGLGYTPFKTAKQELDLKFDAHYERQTFGNTPGVFPPVATSSQSLIGASFADVYALKLPHGILLNENASVIPAFNQPNAWSALGNVILSLPVYKNFSFSVAALDAFLNDPAFGSKKNSFQFTAGVTYSFK